jgi:signal transduction histidine kinase
VAEPKEMVASAIARAQADLAEALAELEKVPAFDPGSVAFVAHALNNFLTVTGGTVELLVEHLGGGADPQVRVWLDGVRHATDLMARTVAHLGTASTTTGAQLRLEKVDLPLLVRRACTHYQRAADRKGIRITVDPAEGVPPVWIDRVVAAAVLDNLMSNAVKYSPPGGEVQVRVRGEAGFGVCEVRDQGPGLSPADQARLYRRGVRLTPVPTGGEPSTGYGLAVAKEMVERLGGEIGCESVLGQGCRFSFRLPAYREPAAGSGTEGTDPGAGPAEPPAAPDRPGG